MDNPPASDTVDRLEAVLAAAGPAHHAAYHATDGQDPEWPLWYARQVVADLRTILSRPDLTESRLVWAFVKAEDAYSALQPEVPWPRFYAERFISDLAGEG